MTLVGSTRVYDDSEYYLMGQREWGKIRSSESNLGWLLNQMTSVAPCYAVMMAREPVTTLCWWVRLLYTFCKTNLFLYRCTLLHLTQRADWWHVGVVFLHKSAVNYFNHFIQISLKNNTQLKKLSPSLHPRSLTDADIIYRPNHYYGQPWT